MRDDDRVEELFAELADLPPAEQEQQLARRCAAEPELATRLRRLLHEDSRGTRGVLASRTGDGDTEERIGPFRLVRVLGEGGMGIVHLAEQEVPVRRMVALKRILPGAHRKATQARFEAESQILAQLDHPGIAKVFEAGTSESGLPWFAMEYVPGAPLLSACDEVRLSIEDRIVLFQHVCDAVQYAHQKGVVHRDLTPRNILVQERDGRLRPKVIDFGIARVLSVSMDDAASIAPEDRPIGTLLSMSPEQSLPEGKEIDTRTDVYALGVVLYELLAGVPPFELAEFDTLERADAQRLLREREPLSPSVRVGKLENGTRAVSRARGLTQRALVRRLAGDLDWIVARAMKKNRLERYSTVAELALDLRHHLAVEPVLAAPANPWYRPRKFIRRHRLFVAAGSLVFLGLVFGIAGSMLGQRRAQAGEEAARVAEAAARRGEAQAERSRAAEERERREAEAMVEYVQHALFYAEIRSAADPELSVAEIFRLASEDALPLFGKRPRAEAAARYMMGRCLLALGDHEAAKAQFLEAYALESADPEEDALDLFATLEGLIRATRLVDGPERARPWVERALEVGRQALGDIESLEPMLRLAAGDDVSTADALAALAAMDGLLAEAEVGDPRTRILGRVFWEATDALRRRSPEDADMYMEAFEKNARELIPAGDMRLPFFLVGYAREELRAERPRPDKAEVLVREVLDHTDFMPEHHWLRAEARRILGLARSAQGDERGAEEALLASRVGSAGVSNPTSASRRAAGGLREFATELMAQGDAHADAFLADSWERWRAASTESGGWWPVTWPEIPRAFAQRAVALLEGESRPDEVTRAQLLRGLIRVGRAEEALAGLLGTDPEVLWLRALALLELGRPDEAFETEARARRAFAGAAEGLAPELRALGHEVRRRLASHLGG